MTDWWSNDPIASAPQPSSAPTSNWWDADKVVMPAPKAAPVDPIVAQARAELDAETAAGRGQKVGPAREFIQGATLGTADEMLAGAMSPFVALRRGMSLSDAYALTKAKENLLLEDERKASGALGSVAEIVGGGGLGAGLYRAGATLAPAITSRLGTGLAGTAAGAVADGAALGALSGAAESEGSARFGGAVTGALTGGALGAGIPLAGAAIGATAAPVVSNISARLNPAAYAERQIGKAATDMRLSPDDVASRLAQAATDGQGEYRLVDALGNAGRRKAAVVAKNPGEGREALVEFLDARQAGQGGRVANALEEGLGATETAQAATTRMGAERRAMDDAAFSAVRNDAQAVNVTPALMRIDDTLRPTRNAMGLNLDNGIAYDSVEGALARARAVLSDGRSQVTDFAVVQRARGDIADAVEKAHRAGEGNKARLLRQVRDELDQGLERSSPGFRDAMAASREAARDINAVDAGTTAATRGRTEDKLAAFGALRPEAQQGFRTGYADPLIQRAQRSAMNSDAARPLTSLATRTELPAFAVPGQGDQLLRRLGRESEMFLTRNKATGGSTTAENLADNAGTGIDPGIIGKLLSGHFVGAAGSALRQGSAALTGNTEAVRAELARQLLRGNADEVRTLLQRLAAQRTRRSDIGATALRGLLGGSLPAIERGLSPNPQRAR